ncbi:MAG: PKD domain-containing protein, partial [Nitrososphaera sp.]
ADDLAVEIGANATEGQAPMTVSFNSTVTGGESPYSVDWDFGDGETATDEQSAVHTFIDPGNYNVTATVTDSNGAEASDSYDVSVNETSTPPPPPADDLAVEIGANATEGQAPMTVSFNSTVTGGESPYSVDWDFGDGETATDEQSAVHTFIDPGNYTVAATVTDANGDTANDTYDVAVNETTTTTQTGLDKWGIQMLYPTKNGGPTWYILEQKDPTADGYYYYGLYKSTKINYQGDGVWDIDARSGTQEHGIREHVDSPSGKWKNTEMTGYFKVLSGDDQITMIARHGPSYHDDGGCLAYGYYALTATDGHVFFKKKLYHFNNGYTKRLAQIDALGDLTGKWFGMKFVVYDLPNGDVKLELWIDQGDVGSNHWKKETELIDKGNLTVEGGDDCGRDANDKIDSGTRVSFRADNSEFLEKKLSVREIQPPN